MMVGRKALPASVGLAFAAMMVGAAPAMAQVTSELAAKPATILGATQFDMPSRIAGRTYRIFVSKPVLPPPPAGYPVVVVLDGNYGFPVAAAQMAVAELGELPPAIIVGVGYPVDSLIPAMKLRTTDLTTPVAPDRVPREMQSGPLAGATFGGGEAFRRFLVEELRPRIAAEHKVDLENQALMGDSLGGLFALDVLLNHPGSFGTFVIGSPSIWWNGRAVLAGEADFARRLTAAPSKPRVLVTVGGLEQDSSNPPPGLAREDYVRLVNEARMVDNARELAERLGKVKGGPGYTVRFDNLADETHISVLPATISRGLGFALKP
jgi:predicted alpha/beta superfamily hydrolase